MMDPPPHHQHATVGGCECGGLLHEPQHSCSSSSNHHYHHHHLSQSPHPHSHPHHSDIQCDSQLLWQSPVETVAAAVAAYLNEIAIDDEGVQDLPRSSHSSISGFDTSDADFPYHPLRRFISFRSTKKPNIDLWGYFDRIIKYANPGTEAFLLLVIYIHRFQKKYPVEFVFGTMSCYRLAAIGLLIAAKISLDKFYTNTRFAKAVGLSVSDLNRMELEFLKLIDGELFATNEELSDICKLVLKRVQVEGPPLMSASNAST